MMKTSTTPRKPIPNAIETQVLLESRRRCCLCFHLDGDSARKSGQIAHVDRNRANHSESNLAFLCLPHHDEYDSRTSQSKGITGDELIHAKRSLLAYVRANFESDTVSISVTIKGDFDKLSETQRQDLLERALKAANVQRSVEVESVSPGSVVFRFITTAEDAAAILEAFNAGRLKEVGVLEVSETPVLVKSVAFSESFDKYSHGIERSEVARTMLSPDSAAFFDGPNPTTPELAAFGLFLRRVTENISLLVIADHASVVFAAYPISHRDVPLEPGTSPKQALELLVERFGIALRLDGISSKLRLGERVRLPRGMSDVEVVRFLERRAEEAHKRHDYELICFMEQGLVVSNYRLMHLLFALAKQAYFASLADLGFRVEGSPLGRFISRKQRGA